VLCRGENSGGCFAADPASCKLSALAPVAQLDRVLGYEPRGRGFESCRAHHMNQRATVMWPFAISTDVTYLWRRVSKGEGADHVTHSA